LQAFGKEKQSAGKLRESKLYHTTGLMIKFIAYLQDNLKTALKHKQKIG
jgi:hypothetical protein